MKRKDLHLRPYGDLGDGEATPTHKFIEKVQEDVYDYGDDGEDSDK